MNVLLLLKETWDKQAKDGKTSTHKGVTSWQWHIHSSCW